MPTTIRRRVLLAFVLALPALAGACNSELQGHAEVFLDALATDDYAKFQSIAGSELVAQLPEGNFLDMAATYEALGPERDRTRTGVEWKNGTASVSYTLDHASGEVQLTVVSKSDKLDGIDFEGAWTATWVERQRKGLEALLTALESGDRAAVRALCHAGITDAEIDGLLKQPAMLGRHTKIETVDTALPEFRVTFEKAQLLITLQMRGAQVVRIVSHRADQAT